MAHHVGYCFHVCSGFPHSCSECVPEHVIVYVGELIPYALHLRIYCFADLCELVVQFLVVPDMSLAVEEYKVCITVYN